MRLHPSSSSSLIQTLHILHHLPKQPTLSCLLQTRKMSSSPPTTTTTTTSTSNPPPQPTFSPTYPPKLGTRALSPLLRTNGGKWDLIASGEGVERSFRFKTFKKTWVRF